MRKHHWADVGNASRVFEKQRKKVAATQAGAGLSYSVGGLSQDIPCGSVSSSYRQYHRFTASTFILGARVGTVCFATIGRHELMFASTSVIRSKGCTRTQVTRARLSAEMAVRLDGSKIF